MRFGITAVPVLLCAMLASCRSPTTVEKTSPELLEAMVTSTAPDKHASLDAFQGARVGDIDALTFLDRRSPAIAAGRRPWKVEASASGLKVTGRDPAQPRGTGSMASAGAGAFLSADGYILTCAHVVDRAPVFVCFLDSQGNPVCTEARVVWAGNIAQAEPDLALLKIDQEPVAAFDWAAPPDLYPGAASLHAGSGFGSNRFCAGELRGVRERKPTKTAGDGKTVPQPMSIVVDAGIGPGDSGGAAMTTFGGLIGINASVIINTETLKRIAVVLRPEPAWVQAKIDADREHQR